MFYERKVMFYEIVRVFLLSLKRAVALDIYLISIICTVILWLVTIFKWIAFADLSLNPWHSFQFHDDPKNWNFWTYNICL